MCGQTQTEYYLVKVYSFTCGNVDKAKSLALSILERDSSLGSVEIVVNTENPKGFILMVVYPINRAADTAKKKEELINALRKKNWEIQEMEKKELKEMLDLDNKKWMEVEIKKERVKKYLDLS